MIALFASFEAEKLNFSGWAKPRMELSKNGHGWAYAVIRRTMLRRPDA